MYNNGPTTDPYAHQPSSLRHETQRDDYAPAGYAAEAAYLPEPGTPYHDDPYQQGSQAHGQYYEHEGYTQPQYESQYAPDVDVDGYEKPHRLHHDYAQPPPSDGRGGWGHDGHR